MESMGERYLIEDDSATWRHHATILRENGMAIFMFGVWTLVRTAIYVFFAKDNVEAELGSVPTWAYYLFSLLIIAVATGIDLLLRHRCWRGCTRQAAGEPCGVGYLAILLFLAAGSAMSVVGIFSTASGFEEIATAVMSNLVDLSSLVLALETLRSARFVRHHALGGRRP